MYDYVVTFDQEVELFWTRKFTGASVLFFGNRYITIGHTLLGMYWLTSISTIPETV